MAEDIGGVYNTKIPAYSDNADIQEAFTLFLYGSTTVPATAAAIAVPSIANYLKTLQDDIDTLEGVGIGSVVSNDEPQDVPDGYIWVDFDAELATEYTLPTVIYQNSIPTENLLSGMLWVDKDSTPLTMHVYDEDLGWRAIGS